MMRQILMGGLVAVVGCGGSVAQVEPTSTVDTDVEPVSDESAAEASSGEPESEPEPEPEPELVAALPLACAGEGEACLPPPAFARATCKGRYPALAVVMFEKSTPWQRLYVNVQSLEPVNTYGGQVDDERLLEFGEELLVLGRQSNGAGGLQVSGADDIDVLRWDGSCVTVRRATLVDYRPGMVKNAPIIWRRLDDEVQRGLLTSKYVQTTRAVQKKACRSSSSRNPTEECKRANRKLNDAITVAVRGGVELPHPEKLPIWADPSALPTASDELQATANAD